jgi:hypothetical protein
MTIPEEPTRVRDSWRKSSYSANTENCVAVRRQLEDVEVMDTKNPGAGVLSVQPAAWKALLGSL